MQYGQSAAGATGGGGGQQEHAFEHINTQEKGLERRPRRLRCYELQRRLRPVAPYALLL